MKNLLIIPILLFSFFSYSQSNTEGTITISAIGGLTSGKVQDNFDCQTCDTDINKLNYKFSSGTYGLNVQYGLNTKFSVGLNLSYGSYLLTRRNLEIQDFQNLQTILGLAQTMELFAFALEGRYYVYNDNEYNVFIGPSVGFSSATDKFVGFDLSSKRDLKASGINYGLKAGINYFLNERFGVVLHASYEGAQLSGNSNDDDTQSDLKREITGFNILTGFVLKL